jgi:hypothetical protein
MEKENDNMRERLLARLPQPENLGAYREETESLLARHEKALFWERAPSLVAWLSATAICVAGIFWPPKTGATMNFWFGVGLLAFAGTITGLKYQIDRSKVDLLKEIKQVQLQLLELQAAMEKRGNGPGL